MINSYLVKGVLIGFMFGIPVGVVGVLTVQRTLAKGFLAGVITGLDSLLADVVYASISIFGITLLSDFLLSYQRVIAILGCIIIICMGIRLVKKENSFLEDSKTIKNTSTCLSSFVITLTNPAAILSFMVVFTTFGVDSGAYLIDKIALVFGIFIGTGVWWFILAALVKGGKKIVSKKFYKKLNMYFGVTIIILGIAIGIYSFIG